MCDQGKTNGEDKLFVDFEPAIANRKEKRAVVAGVLSAEASARMMHNGSFDKQRASLLQEDMPAEGSLRCEVHKRGVSWRNIVRAEQNAASHCEIGRDLFPFREIPLPNYRLEASAVDGTLRRKNGIDGHKVSGPFKIPPQQS